MSNTTTGGDGGSFTSGNTAGDEVQQQRDQLLTADQYFNRSNINGSSTKQQQPPSSLKKKRNLPGNPDPTAEVIALSPTTLMATNRFVCEICKKGFQRDQNLQLHRRGHNLPWKLKQRTSTEIRKRVYVCPEPSCVHHNPARALGDLTGIKKHFSRKHGEKKWKCEKCSKKYAVQSDWKAHSKTCGTREYKCDCGTIFSRRDSFITHRAFCDALSEENNKAKQGLLSNMGPNLQGQISELMPSLPINNPNPSSGTFGFDQSDIKAVQLPLPQELMSFPAKPALNMTRSHLYTSPRSINSSSSPISLQPKKTSSTIFEGNGHQLPHVSAHMSATALLQKAAQMGATVSNNGMNSPLMQNNNFVTSMAPPSLGAMQPQNHDQSFVNQFIQKGQQQETSSQFINAIGMLNNLGMTNMGMLHGLADDENSALLKNVKHDSSKSTNVLHGANTNGSGDMMTVDFLGLGGGSRRTGNFYEQQQQKQQEMGFDGNGQRFQGLSHFQQQAQALMEKHMWEA
ncbi:zinc finger protein GAI-ASSOCIATED FACTOR 1-like [Juglans microcarpa x Juglans regia]|uniref:zinc finger protein GAI-ASSOCIATED FACTOR 1-like n=1 Tax=Juglans microcarpa x Juglans regia TaxID=2249226 RepID=UPI001B7DBFF6|nr:zinc finger protein GAI-ASSOCIATED FACTOR 1-like [Juglans microcarpa x Juglans regia]XP_041021057.1 zinc finger protein GAI-ASSOCIATED FACTOR 1-like [Juglans microcarpa x Juglans regia]